MEQEIKEEFQKSGFSFDEEEDILKKCLTFCISYNLTPADLVSSWEVYYLNRQLTEAVVRNVQMDGFLVHLQNEIAQNVIKEEGNLHVYSSTDVDALLYNEEDVKNRPHGTPERTDDQLPEQADSILRTYADYSSYRSPSEMVTPYGQRKSNFVVHTTGNDLPALESENIEKKEESSEDDIIRRVQPIKRCSLLFHGSKPEVGCKFMYDRIEDRYNYLENVIRNYTKALVSSGICVEAVDPSVASQKSGTAVGMICCEGEGRLNEKSALLQSSVEHSGGQRVRLDLQKLSQFSIFPGQLVGIEGNNPSGHCFIVTKIVDSIPVSMSSDEHFHPAKKRAMDQDFQLTDATKKCTNLSLVIAAGPFTTSDNLLFEPLSDLLGYARRKSPQLLILLGPFIDSEHPRIRKGVVEWSFEEIFRREILRRVQDYVEYMGSSARVFLVPSTRDANHDFVFPQPAFDIQPPKLKHQISSLTNPGVFEADEVRVGCCTADILKHLAGETVTRKPTDGSSWDGRSKLASHIIGQRSFYPLYPPAEGLPVDFSLAPETMHFSSIPEILILPSDLAPFVKVLPVGGISDKEEQMQCICVNPGRIAKGEKGGYFVELNYRKGPGTASASIINI